MTESISDIYFLIFSTILLFFSLVFFIIVFFGHYRVKQKKYYTEKEEMKTSFQQEILRAQLEIQEQTLKNISQEIHDNIGQVLSLAKLNLATTEIGKISSELVQQNIDNSKSLVAKAIQDLRDLSKSLNTDYISDMGLARSIEYELEIIKKTGSFETIFEIAGTVFKLEHQKELILFRIVQEALNNILTHAKAKIIAIQIQYLPSFFSMTVSDNGVGFELGAKEIVNSGIGLKNMRSRAQLLGAEFIISSVLNEGTSVYIKLPVITKT